MKAAWFIDGAYLYREAPFDFDLARLRERVELQIGQPFHDCHYFQATQQPDLDIANKFYQSLQTAQPQGAQVRVHLKKAAQNGHATAEEPDAAAAVALTTALLTAGHERRYDLVVATVAHAYYLEPLNYLRDQLGARLFLAGFENALEPRLQSIADRVLWLNEYWDDVD